MQTYHNKRQYMIFNVVELSAINFQEVLETSSQTILKSTNDNKTFVKWENEIPNCVESLTTKEGPYTHSEIMEILNTEEWISHNSLIYET